MALPSLSSPFGTVRLVISCLLLINSRFTGEALAFLQSATTNTATAYSVTPTLNYRRCSRCCHYARSSPILRAHGYRQIIAVHHRRSSFFPFSTAGSRSQLWEAVSNNEGNYRETNGGGGDTAAGEVDVAAVDPLLTETSNALRRVSWFSWWSQVILTTVAAVILAFARNVIGGRYRRVAASADAAAAALSNELPSFFLSGVGIAVSAVSIIWTWGKSARLSRRLLRKPTTVVQAAHMMRRAVRVAVSLNMSGLLVTLLAAEQVVGTLAVKVLTQGANTVVAATGQAAAFLQPLDILVVQANTNLLLSHFFSLACSLYLTDRIDKLDPPSTETRERNRGADY